MTTTTEGWCMPPNSWCEHYFVAGVSLCGIAYTPRLLFDDGETREDYRCLECRRRRAEPPAPPDGTQNPFPFMEDSAP